MIQVESQANQEVKVLCRLVCSDGLVDSGEGVKETPFHQKDESD